MQHEVETLLPLLGRLALAGILGALLGLDRERYKELAGLRTHMLVCLGSCAIVLGIREGANGVDAISRVVQGVLQGIGFLGAGTILQHSKSGKVRGLTTAASVWVVAVIGACVGLGLTVVPMATAVAAWIVLVPLKVVERKVLTRRTKSGGDAGGGRERSEGIGKAPRARDPGQDAPPQA